jgi:hypothetical protein
MSYMQCAHCQAFFSEMAVTEVIARYADCDVYKAPCCGRTVDNRLWKSLPDMRRVDRDELRRSPHGVKDDMGRFVKVIRTADK